MMSFSTIRLKTAELGRFFDPVLALGKLLKEILGEFTPIYILPREGSDFHGTRAGQSLSWTRDYRESGLDSSLLGSRSLTTHCKHCR